MPGAKKETGQPRAQGAKEHLFTACFAEVFSARGGCGSGSGVPSRVTHKRCLQRPAVLRCATGCLRESSCERSNHPTNSLEPVRPDSGVGGPPPHDRQATPTEPHSSRLTQSNPTGWNRPPPTAGIHDMTYLDQTPFYAHKNTNDRRRARTHTRTYPQVFLPVPPRLHHQLRLRVAALILAHEPRPAPVYFSAVARRARGHDPPLYLHSRDG